MRLWTLSPEYLDPKGLVALWREALLAQKVLKGETKGYRNHPQLFRFKNHQVPLDAIATYLSFVHNESVRRGYDFDQNKILRGRTKKLIKVTDGQVLYEWKHLKEKLKIRDMGKYKESLQIDFPEVNPLFELIKGEIEEWELVKKYS